MHGAKNAFNCYWFLLQKTWKIMIRYGDIFSELFLYFLRLHSSYISFSEMNYDGYWLKSCKSLIVLL